MIDNDGNRESRNFPDDAGGFRRSGFFDQLGKSTRRLYLHGRRRCDGSLLDSRKEAWKKKGEYHQSDSSACPLQYAPVVRASQRERAVFPVTILETQIIPALG